MKNNQTHNNQISFAITLEKKAIEETYQKVLKETAAQADIKGFRKGKAPLQLVEESLDKNKLYQKVIELLLPQAYAREIKQRQLKPISMPKINPVSVKPNQNWTFKAHVALKPTIKLNNYKQKIKGLLKNSSLWLPGQDKSENKKPEKTEDKLNKIFNFLIENIPVEVPELLIEEETNRSLSRLLQQTNRLNLSLDQYLASIGKNADQLRQEHREKAIRTLKLELILQEISQDLQISVTQAEIQTLINTAPDEKSKKALASPPEKAYLKSVLIKRKTSDQLIKLAS